MANDAEQASPRAFRWFLGIGLAAVVAYLAIPSTIARIVISEACWIAAVVALGRGIRKHRPADRLPWRLCHMGLGLAIGMTLATDVSFMLWQRPLLVQLYDPSILAGYALIGTGLLLIARKRSNGDTGALLDTTIAGCVAAVYTWQYVMGGNLPPIVTSPMSTQVAGLLPVADVLMLTAVARLLFAPGRKQPALRLLLVGPLFQLLADVAFTYVMSQGSFERGGLVEPLWMVAALTMGAAALHPTMGEVTTVPPELTRTFSLRRLVMPLLTLAALPGLVAVSFARSGGHPGLDDLVLPGVLFVLGGVRFGVLVVESERAQRRLDELSRRDALTGLLNRGGLFEHLRWWETASTQTVGVVFADLDGFKQVNDTLGHGAGDDLLVQVAERLRTEVVRETDVVARLGGDEFVVLLPGARTTEQVTAIAERVLEVVAKPYVVAAEGGRPTEARVGASIGFTVHRHGPLDPDRLLEQADAAMYAAKRAGRGRWVDFDVDDGDDGDDADDRPDEDDEPAGAVPAIA